jgi:hypothetical protein
MALAEALKHHAVRSGITDAKLTKMLDRQYDPHFSLKHMFKDVQLGIHIANSLDIDLPATTSTAGVMYGGLTRGWADDDFSVLARSYQKEDQPQPPLAVMGPSGAPPPPPPKENTALPAPGMEKREPPRESTAEELRNAGVIIPEPPPPIAEAPKPAAPPETSKEPMPPVQPATAPAAPTDAAPAHTPFVRIRRWFGTGSTN